jgi:hypothetical protein
VAKVFFPLQPVDVNAALVPGSVQLAGEQWSEPMLTENPSSQLAHLIMPLVVHADPVAATPYAGQSHTFCTHCELAVSPVAVDDLPVGHVTQALPRDEAIPTPYVPAPQFVHSVTLDLYSPAAHE